MLRELFPESVVVVVSEPAAASVAGLYPEEADAVASAVEKRRHEFAAGRACARRALSILGYPPAAIPVGPDRAPIWPEGVIGTISHCARTVVAAVARVGDLRGIGVDVEPAEPLPANVVRLVCTPREQAELPAEPPPPGVDWPKIVFCAKESIHKVIAPSTGIHLGFQDVDVLIDPATATFRARNTGRRTTVPELELIEGRFAADGQVVAAAAILRGTGAEAPPAGRRD